MRIAYYAPLKPPDHPVPSGDRRIAQSLLQALGAAGHDAFCASRFRSLDTGGDRDRQMQLRGAGERIAQRLIARWRDDGAPDLWFTYHVYHKAPDWLGPAVTRALGIPYVIAEASIAPGQRDGAWAQGHAQALTAIRAADALVVLNPADVAQVRAIRGADARDEPLAPFIDVAAFAGSRPRAPSTNTAPTPIPTNTAPTPIPNSAALTPALRLTTIAMMRERAKLVSYRLLAAALGGLCDLRWALSIIGDGPARRDVEAAFAGLGGRVRFLGARPAPEIAAVLAHSDLFVWPAIDEAIGMVFLEAQACGVPVVGADSPGVAAVVAAGRTGLLAAPGDVDAFAAATRLLLSDAATRERMANDAFDYVRERHDLPAAAARLDAIVRRAAGAHRAREVERGTPLPAAAGSGLTDVSQRVTP